MHDPLGIKHVQVHVYRLRINTVKNFIISCHIQTASHSQISSATQLTLCNEFYLNFMLLQEKKGSGFFNTVTIQRLLQEQL